MAAGAASLLPRFLHRRLLRVEAAIEDALNAFSRSLPPGSRVVDIGAGESRYAERFAHTRYVALDLGAGDSSWDYSKLSAAAAAERLPFADGSFDAALQIVVLEHVRDPQKAVREMARVLRRGGRGLIVVPLSWEVHQAPHDYFRYTNHGLLWLLEQAGLTAVSLQPIGGFFVLLARRMLNSMQFFQRGLLWLLLPAVAVAAGTAGLLLPSLDWLDRKKDFTLGYVCIAEKR